MSKVDEYIKEHMKDPEFFLAYLKARRAYDIVSKYGTKNSVKLFNLDEKSQTVYDLMHARDKELPFFKDRLDKFEGVK